MMAHVAPTGNANMSVVVDVVNLMIWNQLRPLLPHGTKLNSVKRPAAAQLQFIVIQAQKLGYKFSHPPTLHDHSSWQGALDFLRHKGFKIAAPGKSNHQSGIAYDLSGPNLNAIEAAVRRAVEQKRITLLANSRSAILQETKNHCVHVEITGAVLYNEQFVDFPHLA
jgi:hypothetical protein